jgi:hypothetical protein
MRSRQAGRRRLRRIGGNLVAILQTKRRTMGKLLSRLRAGLEEAAARTEDRQQEGVAAALGGRARPLASLGNRRIRKNSLRRKSCCHSWYRTFLAYSTLTYPRVPAYSVL